MKRKGAGYHHGDLRRALVEATIRLVDSHGTEGFTLRAAAKLAGVSDGAPYHHFTDKEALLATVAEESLQLLHDEMTRAAGRVRGEARKKGFAMGAAYVLFAAKHPARFRLMFGPPQRAERRRRKATGPARKTLELIQVALAEGFSERWVREPSEDAILSMWALLHGLSMLAVDGHIPGRTADARRLERLVCVSMESLLEPGVRVAMLDDDDIPKSSARPRSPRGRAAG